MAHADEAQQAAAAQHEDGTWAGDVAGGFARAALRGKQSLYRHATSARPRVSAVKAGRHLDRLSSSLDLAEAVRSSGEEHNGGIRELYARRGALGLARSVAVPFLASVACGTALFAVYETSLECAAAHAPAAAAPVLPFVCGALGGAVHGAARELRLSRVCATDAAEFAVAFGVFDVVKLQLVGETEERAAHKAQQHGELSIPSALAIAAAGACAGAAQSAASQMLQRQRPRLRAVLRAGPAGAVGFAAWEYGKLATAASG
jgi:hypothetical protein